MHDAPRRIVSLVPSQTELLAELGLSDKIVGRTRWCIHPGNLQGSIIGGTKDPDIEHILSLQPDLVIANLEENQKEHIQELEKKVPVWVSDVSDIPSAIRLITDIGDLTGTANGAGLMANQLVSSFQALTKQAEKGRYTGSRVAFMIWNGPLMAAGGDTHIHAMLDACGFSNVYAECDRYPETSIQELSQRKPDLVLLTSEPFAFTGKHMQEMARALPAKYICVNGEYFTWYGSRPLTAVPYFHQVFSIPLA